MNSVHALMGRLLALTLVLWMAPWCRAEILEVPTVYPGLQEALDLVEEGDTVLVLPGVYEGHFEVPDVSMTLAGRHLFSSDSSDIAATVLDGQGTGSVVRIRSLGQRVTTVHGLTLRNGMGATQGFANSEDGGAIRLDDNSNATLRWLNIEHNRAPRGGAVMAQDGDWGRLRLEHLRLYDNGPTEGISTSAAIQLHGTRTLWLEDLQVGGSDLEGRQFRVLVSDSLTVRGVHLEGLHFSEGILVSLMAPHVELDGLSLRDCVSSQGYFIIVNAIETLVAHNIEATGNRETADALGQGAGAVLHLVSSGEAEYHNIRFNGNHCPHGGWMLQLQGARNTDISDLEILGNSLGVPVTLQSASLWDQGTVARLVANGIRGLRVEDNRVEMPRLPGGGLSYGMGAYGGLLMLGVPEEGGPVTVGNLSCLRNELFDPDPPGANEEVNTGTCLTYSTSTTARFRLVDSVFAGNTQNRANVPLGTNMNSFPPTLVSLYGGRQEVIDCLVLDNTAGAIYSYSDSLVMRNVQQVDPGPYGMYLAGDAVVMRNVLVQGVHLPAGAADRPDACALYLYGSSGVDLANCTVSGCNTRSLLSFADWELPGNALLRNCALTGNVYDALEYDWPSAPFAAYNYSLLGQEQPGTGNLVAADHAMVGDRLLREFRPGSPCIDGGNPDEIWSDVTINGYPGDTVYPSMGGRRNDIGHLGGPWAKPLPCIDAMPGPPDLRITALPGRIRLEWDPVTESFDGCPAPATTYRVDWAPEPGGPWQHLADTPAPFLEVPRVLGQSRRFYRVISLGLDLR
jgi:hypothetical protein